MGHRPFPEDNLCYVVVHKEQKRLFTYAMGLLLDALMSDLPTFSLAAVQMPHEVLPPAENDGGAS